LYVGDIDAFSLSSLQESLQLPNLLMMNIRMWIWEEIHYQTMISRYFIYVLDAQTDLSQDHKIDTVLIESAKMI